MKPVRESKRIREYRLGNGLTLLVLPDHSAPVATVMVTYGVGSADEVPGETGATHFLEHMMFKGSKNFNRKQGNDIFSLLQSVGARINATTWVDRTNYYELLPSGYLELALEVESDRMRGLLLEDTEIASEKTVILNEHDRGENEPFRRLNKKLWQTVFEGHPYGHPTIGWRTDIENTSRDSLVKFYNAYYWPVNTTLSIIGDVTYEGAYSLASKHFGGIDPGKEISRQTRNSIPGQTPGLRTCEVRMTGDVGTVMLGIPTVPALHRDCAPLAVLAHILFSGRKSTTARALEDSGLASSSGGSSINLRDSGMMWAYANLMTTTTVDEAGEKLLETVLQVSVTEKDVAQARQSILEREPLNRDGTFQIATLLNEAIAVGDWQYFTDYADRIARVTPQDVVHVKETYLREARSTVAKFHPETIT